jgi:hypothetical protein
LSDGSDEIEVIVHHHEEKPARDDQPVYDEISEVKIAQKPASSISIETPEGLDDDSNVVEEPIAPKVTNTPFFNTPSPLEPQIAEPIEIEEENQGLPFYLKIIIAFAIIVAIGLAAYFIKPELFNGALNKSDNGLHDNSELIKNNDKIKTDSIAQADSIRIANERAIQTADSIKKDSLAVSPAPTPAVSGATVSGPEGPVTWEVIGASVINQKEADKFIAQMKAIGITAKVIPTLPGKRRLKISIATFKDEESAREGRKLLVTKLKDPGIYIHQNKHTHKPQ